MSRSRSFNLISRSRWFKWLGKRTQIPFSACIIIEEDPSRLRVNSGRVCANGQSSRSTHCPWCPIREDSQRFLTPRHTIQATPSCQQIDYLIGQKPVRKIQPHRLNRYKQWRHMVRGEAIHSNKLTLKSRSHFLQHPTDRIKHFGTEISMPYSAEGLNRIELRVKIVLDSEYTYFRPISFNHAFIWVREGREGREGRGVPNSKHG